MNQLNPQESLKLFDEGKDCFNRDQLYSAACSVFLRKDGKIYLMKQTKSHRVVGDNYVGIGGKSVLENYTGQPTEKLRTESLVTSIYMNKLNVEEDIREVAVREVFEETSGTKESPYGIKLDKEKLKSIGSSTIRLLNNQSNGLWEICYFLYDLDGTEGTITPENTIEGIFELFDENEILNLPMLPADRIILNNMNSDLRIEAIYDDINNKHIIRCIFTDGLKATYILIPDASNVSDYIGQIVDYGTDEENNGFLSKFKVIDSDLRMELLQHFNTGKIISEFSFPEGEELIPYNSETKLL